MRCRSRTTAPVTNQLEDTLARLTRLHPKLIDLTLGRIERLLARLGHPEKNLPPVVHVAGTNGKGSLIAFLHAILKAAGYRVHVYTSPHLVTFNERIVLDGALIDDATLAGVIDECETANDGAPITFFEITTAAALLAFARTPADIVLLETGLGGRLDATNLIARPHLCAITPISLDHQHFLGDTLEEIAAEKAAILKPGVPAIIGRQSPEALQVIESRSKTVRAPLRVSGHDWLSEPSASGFVYRAGTNELALPRPSLAGDHQIENAAMAVACAQALDGFDVPLRALEKGVSEAVWAARLQPLDITCFTNRFPAGADLWLDGGHNAAAGAALAETASHWSDRPLHLIVGMMQGKDIETYLKPLSRLADAIWAVPIPGESNAHSPATVAKAARTLGVTAYECDDLTHALDGIPADPPLPRILICGSLYLAGHVLAEQGHSLNN